MACGTGKTLTSLFIKEKLTAQRTLVLVPSLSLLKQTMRVWSANRRDEFAPLPVCSDATVSNDDDAAVMYTSDLGVPVTTDPKVIAAFLRKRGPRVVFCTYQSSPQIAKAFELGRVPAFDLVVADEAHRCAGPVSSDFATVLDADKIKARRRLYMTATPRYFTGRVIGEAKEADFEYASMDDEAKFGNLFHRLGFSEAIRRGLLTDYQVAIIGVDNATYREVGGEGRIRDPRREDHATREPWQGRSVSPRQCGNTASAGRSRSTRGSIGRKEFADSVPEVVAWMPAPQRPKGRALG